jgi:hypothetical protein
VTSAIPDRHPDQDRLADLAAEALPLGEARETEAHVMACPSCERLLADAERVRHLLSGPDPGRMPDDVWLRIEGNLAAESVRRQHAATGPISTDDSGRGWFDPGRGLTPTGPTPTGPTPTGPTPTGPTPTGPTPTGPTPTGPTPTGPLPAELPVARNDDTAGMLTIPSPPPSMSFDEAPTAAWKRFLDEPEPAASAGPAPLRVGRVVRSTMRTRRDVRTEDKAAGRRFRPGVLVAAAAAVVVILGLGTVGVLALRNDQSGRPAADVIPGGAARKLVTWSGAEYTASTLVAQAKALIEGRSPATGVRPSSASTSASTSTGTSAGGSPSAPPKASTSPSPAVTGTVADPVQLASCLRVVSPTADALPVAVDFGTYQGRQAAIVVVTGGNGGYDVWVVNRDCRPEAATPLAFKRISG